MRVELNDIHKSFGPVHANKGITLTLEPGTIYALLGENGAGKSTLMKILSGYQPQTSGDIVIDGKVVTFDSPSDALAAGVGMLYQDPHDFPPLRVVENHLLMYDDTLVLDFAGGSTEVQSYGERFNFESPPESYVDTLTVGERQQIEMLRLLALGADLLILDEPTTGISAEQKEVLFATMQRLAHEDGKTLILVSHKLEEVQELCDAIAVLRAGALVGTAEMPVTKGEIVRMMFGGEVPFTPRPPIDPGKTVLSVKNASIETDRFTVEDVSIELTEGEIVGLAGLEGSGQRALLQAAAGLLENQAGEVLLDDAPITGKRSPFFWVSWLVGILIVGGIVWNLIRLIGGSITGLQFAGQVAITLVISGAIWLVGQVLIAWTSESAYHRFRQRGGAFVPADRLEEGLVPGLTLTDHMALLAEQAGFGVDWNGARNEIDKRIEKYNIIGKPETHVDALSGGNQQRAMIALLSRPLRLLLLEHPTRGLDVTSANWIWELFGERQKEGTAIMFISADLDELLDRADRIAVFSGGRLTGIKHCYDTNVEELGHLIGGEGA